LGVNPGAIQALAAPNCHHGRGWATIRLPVVLEILAKKSTFAIGLANKNPWPTATPSPCS
jgi:hypothetical protein